LGATPKFDGTDSWPVAPELLSNPADPTSSTITFANASITAGTYDSGTNQTYVIRLPFVLNGKSTSLDLTLHAARLTMTLSADRRSATGGMLGGVINTEEFVAEVKKIGYLLGLCTDPLLATLITQVRQASDILSDGTQDPTKTCDGISMGMTFTMAPAQIG